MKEYRKYLNEVFSKQNNLDEGMIQSIKDTVKSIWNSLSGDLGTIISGVLVAASSLSPASLGAKGIESGNIIEAIAWILVFVSMLGTGMMLTVSGYFSITTIGQMVENIKRFVMGRIKSSEELEKLSIQAQEIFEKPEMKKYKGFITSTKNKIRSAIENKDWSEAWRYVEILKQKLSQYEGA